MDKLNEIRVNYLGKKGQLTAVLKGMKDVAPEDRPKVGQMVNETREEIEKILEELDREEAYGLVLRAKGMVPCVSGGWIYFDYVPEERNVRKGKPDVTGKFCVIGSNLRQEALAELFKK